MKTETIEVRSWDDLIFSDRNKAYGAYAVRKSYSKSMITGLGISVSLACLLIIIPKLLTNSQNSLPPEKPNETTTILTIEPPPRVDPPRITPPPPPPPSTQVQAPIRDLTPQVVVHEVETELPTRDEIDASSPTTSGDGPVTLEVPLDLPPVDDTDYNKEFISVQVQPKFQEGTKSIAQFISRNTKYPSAARRIGVEGTVYVTFVVDKDGNVKDAKVVRGISEECDKEAVRVISAMKGWSPGMQNDHKVAVRMTLPIRFQMIQ